MRLRYHHLFWKSLMPCTESDKIKRALTWIRKTLDITERTNMPEGIMRNIKPTLDAFGWERIAEAQNENLNGTLAASTVVGSATPLDTVRLVLAASVETTDPAALHLWFEQRTTFGGGIDISLMVPFLAPAGTNGMRVGLPQRPILLSPRDTIVGRSNPAPAAGTRLIIRWRWIDLPLGEYIFGT